MEELKMAQFYNNYTQSKEKTVELLKTVDVNYCVQDKLPGKQVIREWSGYTSLHFAVKALALDLTNELLEIGADLFKQGTRDECTPLHVAMNLTFTRSRYDKEMSTEEYKDYRIRELQEYRLLNILLSKQVDINNPLNPKNKYGVSHLHIACTVNHAKAVEFFAKAKVPLDQSVNHDFNDDESFTYTMQTAQLQGYTPLHCAVKYSSVEAAEKLMQYGADIHVANEKGMSCVHLLIERKMIMTDFITLGKRTLCMSCVEEIEKIDSIIKLVLKTRAADDIFVDKIGLSAFHLACTLGDRTIIEFYLQRQADVNMRVKNESEFWPGWTPLHFAACFNIDNMVLLMKSGADITIENSKGKTALDLCAKKFTPVDVQLILSTKDEFKEIVLSDNSTKLTDLLLAMNDYAKLKDFLQNLKDVNLTIPFNSPIWAGYSLLHLSVALNEKAIDCKSTIRFELPEARNNDIERYNCTEAEEALYWKRIELCLVCGCSMIMQNAKGQTPIHLAFRMLSEETVKGLLKRSGDNVVDEDNLSHLHIACAVGDLEAVKRYSSKGANLNCSTRTSFDWHERNWLGRKTMKTVRVGLYSTPLHVAVTFDHTKLVEYLLKRNANVYAKDSLDLTPVHLSMDKVNDWTEKRLPRLFFEMIPNLRNSVSKTGLSHVHVAAAADEEEAVKRMLAEGAEVEGVVDADVKEPSFLADFAGKTPLRVAVEAESIDVIVTLLQVGANIHAKNLEGSSVLQYSMNELERFWSTPLPRLLKDGEYDIEGSGITLLHFACGGYELEWAEKLLKNGADVNARISAEGKLQGATPLYVLFVPACIYEVDSQTIVSFVKLLLDKGADVTIECGEITPLHVIYQDMLSNYGFYRADRHDLPLLLQIVDLMLESHRSFSANPIDQQGFSHFHFACARNNVEAANKFLDQGVDVNQSVDPFTAGIGGFTPLHFAMAHRCTEVAYLLLERGADVKAQDTYGNEPLQVGIKMKVFDVTLFETMISHGADIHAKNLRGETLLHCLLKYGELTLEKLEFFFNHGCFINILESHQGIFGSAMLSAAPNEFLPILKRLAQVLEVKTAIQSGFNVIQSIVAVTHEGKLTVDNYLSSIEFLIDTGCELDQQDTEGNTALHKAASFCNFEATDALLQLGADVNILNYTNKCPFSDNVVKPDREYANDSREMNFVKTLACHIWKMKFFGLNVHDSNLRYIGKSELQLALLKQSCQDELRKAEKTEIVENLTLKDFLSEFEAVRRYPRLGTELRTIVDNFFKRTVDLRREFPELCGLLAMQYRKACARRELLQPSGDAIISICQVNLPDLCLEAILGFFTNNDMKTVISSVKAIFK